MKICLKTRAKEAGIQKITVNLHERLPVFVNSACELSCEYQVERNDNYYLLSLRVAGEVDIICQRCLKVFVHPYHNTSQLAVCNDDNNAQALMEHFECLVSIANQVDLTEILTDDLYLFVPQIHPHLSECDSEISRLISDHDDLIA